MPEHTTGADPMSDNTWDEAMDFIADALASHNAASTKAVAALATIRHEHGRLEEALYLAVANETNLTFKEGRFQLTLEPRGTIGGKPEDAFRRIVVELLEHVEARKRMGGDG